MTTIEDEEEKTEFTFDELSQSAKDKACQQYAEHCMDHEWWEYVYQDFTERCEAAGFMNPKFQFSGFWSQGDGASFSCDFEFRGLKALEFLNKEDHDQVLRALFEAKFSGIATDFYVGGRIKTGWHYSNVGSMTMEDLELRFDDTDRGDINNFLFLLADGLNFLVAGGNVLEAARDIANDLYRALEKEYYYMISEEQVAETCEANDWKFNENGDILF
jgi:hypothetical protein